MTLVSLWARRWSQGSVARAGGLKPGGCLGSWLALWESRHAWGLQGMRRGLLRMVLNALRVEVCNGRLGSGEPGKTECARMRRS